VGVLTNTVANLDNYHPVAETSVKFGFNKDNLTQKAQEALDQLAAQIASTKGYIIALEGGTDSVGPADYNYDLSQRRANSVIQYLASKYNVPAHKIYVIGLGKDKPVEPNKTSAGRADNRRVDVRLMTNTTGGNAPASTPTTGSNPSSM
jgi:outer membrane protein OmpA-like peptidoglycan-associated protein